MGILNKFRKDSFEYTDEIVEHLNDLLNTKREFGSCPQDYGLDSYIYLGSNDQILKQITMDIQTGLKKYEKRIENIEVLHVPNDNPFTRAFLIKCKIKNKTCSFHLSFQQQKHLYKLEVVE